MELLQHLSPSRSKSPVRQGLTHFQEYTGYVKELTVLDSTIGCVPNFVPPHMP